MKENILRMLRNAELTGCDWTQANDSPLSDSKKAEWATYRQKLRDFPSKVNFDDIIYDDNLHIIKNVPWPTKPE
tara:strand:+ start:378 stop:599 length:222 start_codon:yes stop_codon:yes gene_type:complete